MKTLSCIFALILWISLSCSATTTRYWVGGGTALGNDGSKWSLTSGGTPIGGTISWQTTDIAVFDANSGSNIVILINAIGTIGKLIIDGNQTVTVKCDGVENRTLNLSTASDETFYLGNGSTFVIDGASNGRILTVRIDNGATASIHGHLKVTSDGDGVGLFTKSSNGTIIFRNGSTYEHNLNGRSFPIATWNSGSTCLITGVINNVPGNLSQTYHHFIWNCPAQTSNITLGGSVTAIKGNFLVQSTNNRRLSFSNSASRDITVEGNVEISTGSYFRVSGTTANNNLFIGGYFLMTGGYFTMTQNSGADVVMTVNGNFTLQNGWFRVSTSNGNSTLNLKRDFTMNGGYFVADASSIKGHVYFNGGVVQNFLKTGGRIQNKMNCTVETGTTLDMGISIWDNTDNTGTFTLQSGATLRTTHQQGITSSGATGCIQNNSTRTFNSGAHYHFYRNGSQATGNGLPSTISGSVTIGSNSNTTSLSFSNSTTINGALVISKGTVATSNISYGAAGTLEYSGNAAQTMGNNEWPSSTLPVLRINNSSVSGVTMNAGKTVTNNLNLQSGTLNIGSNNTLTLHNSTITVNSGSLTGGGLSGITFTGSGNATLPGVSGGLKDLTINRSGATITIGGAVNVTGTLTMTAGSCSLGAGSITYGPSAILLYNGSATQTTGSAEFPASNQPAQINFANSIGVNLHENRSFSGTISLEAGNFDIGNFKLTFDGFFEQSGGSIVSGASGELLLSENAEPVVLPGNSNLAILTVNRSGGVSLNGNATINSNLKLESGDLSIGEYQLTLHGAITQTSGTLTGGDDSNLLVGGLLAAATTLKSITLANLQLNRPNGLNLDGDVTIKEQLTLSSGTLNIGLNTLFIDGTISGGGALSGAGSTLQINESENKTVTELPQSQLGFLNIYRSTGVKMTGDVTVHNALNMLAGELNIGKDNMLTLIGTLNEDTGTLVSGIGSGLTISGMGETLDLYLTDISNLILIRPNGIKLHQTLNIWGTFVLFNANLDLNGNKISYQGFTTLVYRGLFEQTVTEAEWPVESPPYNIQIENFNNVNLSADRTIEGFLIINFGDFDIHDNTIYLEGGLMVSATGMLICGTNSNVVIQGGITLPEFHLPQVTLTNLIVNRVTGVRLHGDVEILGNLTLTNGIFNINNHTLTLRNPIAGNRDYLASHFASSLVIAGDLAGLNIGPEETIRLTELNNLTILNTSDAGVLLNENLDLAGSLIVGPASKFYAGPSSWLTVFSDLILNDEESMILQSDSDGTASLILYGEQHGEGTVKSERYIKGYTSNTDGWHLLASPVDNFIIEGSSIEPGTHDDLYTYSEPENMWLNYKVPGNFHSFESCKGYLIARQTTGTKWFSGSLSVFSYTFDGLTFTDERGWHLFGNPYSSSLSWNDGHWHLIGINAIAKLWKESIHNYIDLDPGGVIPPHNGFFIKVNHEVNHMAVPADSRVHSDVNWHKSNCMPTLTLTAQSLENNTATICRIRFNELASEDFDHNLDSDYLSGFNEPPAFFSVNDKNIRFSTNTLPFSDETVVPLYFSKGLSNSYRIIVEGLETFSNGSRIILTDLKLNKNINLAVDNSYTFTSSAGDAPDRFRLFFSSPTSIEEMSVNDEPKVFYANGRIIIKLKKEEPIRNWLVEMFDIAGRKVMSAHINSSNEIPLRPGTTAGIYLIRLRCTDAGSAFSTKVSIL